MKLNNLVSQLEKVELFARKKSPTILAGLALIGLVTTGITAYKAGLKADEILKKKKKDMEDTRIDDKEARRAVVKETVKEVAPIVAPPIIMGIVSGACIIGSLSVSNRRIAALTAAYTMSESAVRNLTTKAEELIGDKKVTNIRDAVAQEKLNKMPQVSESNVILTGYGNTLCKDDYTGRLFRSNPQKVEQAILQLSSKVSSEMYCSLNEFYYLLGIDDVPLGRDIGWNVDDLMRGRLPIYVSALLTDSGEPCLCIEYTIKMRRDYTSLSG